MLLCVHASYAVSVVSNFCDPMGYSLPGSSVREIPRARILQWAAMPSSMGFSQPRDQTRVSYVSCRQVLYH